MSQAIARDAPLLEAVPGAAGVLLEEAAATVRARARGEVTEDRAVHGIRKTVKKTRALLRLVRCALDPEHYEAENRRLQALGHRLAAAREGRALEETFAGLTRHAPQEICGALARAGDVVRAKRRETRRLSDAEWDQLADEIAAAARALGRLVLHRHAEARTRTSLARAARAARNRLDEVEQWPTAPKFHAVRRRVKDLLFMMELLGERRSKAHRELHDRLDRVAEILGDEHDLSVLIAAIDGAADVIPVPDLDVITPWIEQRRARLRDKALARARRLLDRRRRLVRSIAGDALTS